MAQPETKEISQYLDNKSFNSTYKIYENLGYGYSSDDSAIHALAVDATGKLKVGESPLPTGAATETTLNKLVGLNIGEFDKATQTQNATQDIWAFELNATPTKTVTITYTDATKVTISTVILT